MKPIPITERKRKEDALRESDIRLNKLSSWVPGMIYQFTRRPDGTYCVPFTTEAIRGIFGCSPQDVREDFSPIAGVILPEDFARVVASIERSAQHLAVWKCEYRVQIPGRPIRWIYGISTPERLGDGSITWYGFNTDITERKRVEEGLKKSEKQYRSLTENINLGIYRNTIGSEGKFIEANPAIIRMFGYRSKKEFLNKNVSDLYQKSEDRDNFNNKMIREGFVRGEELWLKKKDGTRFIGSVSAVAVKNAQGHMLYYDGIIDDITERKRAEKAVQASESRYRQLVENANEAIFVAQDGFLKFVNRTAIEMIGYSETELISRPFPEFIHPDDREMVVNHYRNRLAGETDQPRYAFRLRTHDGNIKWVEIGAVLIDWEDRPATLNFLTDITDRRKGEEIIQASLREKEVMLRRSTTGSRTTCRSFPAFSISKPGTPKAGSTAKSSRGDRPASGP